MKQGLFFMLSIFLTIATYGIEGLSPLEKELYDKNQELLSLQKEIQAKDALLSSASASYYPTLNAVGGYLRDETDKGPLEKGSVGYLEGKLNLFHGFKDSSLREQKNLDLQISQIDFEIKKHALKVDLVEVISDMILLHNLQNILNEEINETKNQKQMASKKVAAGLTSSVDNYEIELREREIELEQTQINQKHLEAHQKLLQLFGTDIEDSLLHTLEFSPINNLAPLPSFVDLKSNILEIQKINLLTKKIESELLENRTEFLPSLDFNYSFGRLTPSNTSPMDFKESQYGLLLTIPLFSGFESYHKTRASSSQVQSMSLLTLQKVHDVESAFNSLKSKLSELKILFEINEKKRQLSEKYFSLTLTEYKRGIKNSPDLVNATERLYSTKKRKFELLKEFEVTQAKLKNYL